MNLSRTIVAFVALAALASAHRLDEYLQATTVALEEDHVTVAMRLSPGVAITPIVLAAIDRNADGVISEVEGNGYAEGLLRELSLTLNGETLAPRLVSKTFATTEAMREGVGEIHLEFIAGVPRHSTGKQTLHLQNRHLPGISAYLVNALTPSDPRIVIATQKRNFTQSSYSLDYSRAGATGTWLFALALLFMTRLAFVWRRA